MQDLTTTTPSQVLLLVHNYVSGADDGLEDVDADKEEVLVSSFFLPPFLPLFLLLSCVTPCCEFTAAQMSLTKTLFFPDTRRSPGTPASAIVISNVDGNEGMLTRSNPESPTFGLPVIGDIGSLLPRHAGVRARTLERDAGRSSVLLSPS